MNHVIKNAGITTRPNSYSIILEGNDELGRKTQLRMKVDYHSIRKLADILPLIGSRVSHKMPIIELVLTLPIDVMIKDPGAMPSDVRNEYSTRQITVRVSDNVIQFHLLVNGSVILVNPRELQDVIWSLLAQMSVPCMQQDKAASVYLGDAKFAQVTIAHYPNSLANATCLVIGENAAVLADYSKVDGNNDDPALGKYQCIDRNIRVFIPDANRSVWKQAMGVVPGGTGVHQFITNVKEFRIQ